MADFDNTNRVSVFTNDKKGNDKAPDFTGTVNVEGKDFSISLWKRVSKNGLNYLSGQIQEPRQKQSDSNQQPLGGEAVDVSQIPF